MRKLNNLEKVSAGMDLREDEVRYLRDKENCEVTQRVIETRRLGGHGETEMRFVYDVIDSKGNRLGRRDVSRKIGRELNAFNDVSSDAEILRGNFN